MSPQLPRVDARRVMAALRRFGFTLHHVRGSHHVLRSADGTKHVTVPAHAGETIGPGLLRSILQQAGVDVEAFREAL